MRYFVTGGTGFVGCHLVHQLTDRDHDVVALVRSPSKARHLPDGVETVEGDVTDKRSMREGMAGADGVFHLAAWYRIGSGDSETAERANVDGTRNVLELVDELGVEKAVYTSSVAVFSDTCGETVDESYRHDGSHLSVYDRTKWRAHYNVAEPMMRDGVPLVVVMPGAVYGTPVSGAGDESDLREMWRRYLRGRLPFVTRETAACWDYVADCARAHRLAMQCGEPGKTYIIAGDPRTFVDVFDLAEQITGISAPRSISPRWVRTLARATGRLDRVVTPPKAIHPETLSRISGTTWLADNSKAKTELGLTHRPLEDGLREYLEWERARLNSGA